MTKTCGWQFVIIGKSAELGGGGWGSDKGSEICWTLSAFSLEYISYFPAGKRKEFHLNFYQESNLRGILLLEVAAQFSIPTNSTFLSQLDFLDTAMVSWWLRWQTKVWFRTYKLIWTLVAIGKSCSNDQIALKESQPPILGKMNGEINICKMGFSRGSKGQAWREAICIK